MKYKTFLTTLALFLFFIILGISLISVVTFNDTIQRAEDKSLNEHYFIVSALTKDIHAADSRGVEINDHIELLLQPYTHLFQNGDVKLAFFEGSELVYSNQSNPKTPPFPMENVQDNSRYVTIEEAGDQTWVAVAGRMPEPYHNYSVAYLYEITDAIKEWENSKYLLLVSGLLLSTLLALGLLLVLNRLFKPLKQISEVSSRIAAGRYETRLPVMGKDELSKMANSFNKMAEDIQLRIQQLTIASEQKQQFVDNLAHELRTPLTAIYGYAEYLQKVARTDEDKLFATNYIMSESRRLQNIAQRLLDLAIIRENQLIMNNVPIEELFSSVEQAITLQSLEKKIEVIFKHNLKTLYCDQDLMHILLVNLIDNAIKASEEGSIIKVTADIEDGLKVISVEDNGNGMTEEHLNRITEPFYRVDTSRSRDKGGAGLGLTLSKQIAVSHGGELRFISKVGKGTTVKLIM